MWRSSATVLLVVLILGLAGCSGGAEQRSASQSDDATVPAEVTSVGTTPVPTPTDPAPAESAATSPTMADEVIRYTWTVSFEQASEDGAGPTLIDQLITVHVDRGRDVALVEFDVAAVPASQPSRLLSTRALAFIDDVQLVRGFPGNFMGWRGSGEPDPEVWYLGRQLGSPGLPDVLSWDATSSEFYRSLGLDPEASSPVPVSELEADRLKFGEDNFLAAMERVDLLDSGQQWIEVSSDEFGRVTEIMLESDGPNQGDVMWVEIEYATPFFEVPSLDDAETVPNEPEPTPGSEGIAFRLLADREVILTTDHKLIDLPRPGLEAGPDDFSYLQLTATGAERLLDAVAVNPAVASGEVFVFYDGYVSLEMGRGPDVLRADDLYEPGAVDFSADIDALVGLVQDPSWLVEGILSGPHPWTPERLLVHAYPDSAPQQGEISWPIDEPIRSLGTPASGQYWPGLAVCLQGADLEALWPLLDDPFGYEQLPMNDGESWTVVSEWRGYRTANC